MPPEPGILTEEDVAAIVARAMAIDRRINEAALAEDRYRVLHASANELGISPAQLRRAIERYVSVGASPPDWSEQDIAHVLQTALALREEGRLEEAMLGAAMDAGVSAAALAVARDQYDREAAERVLRASYGRMLRQRRFAFGLLGVAVLTVVAWFSSTAALLAGVTLAAVLLFWPGELGYSEQSYQEWVRDQTRAHKTE
jgi:hypothetical protein